jgi:hypothetical protein
MALQAVQGRYLSIISRSMSSGTDMENSTLNTLERGTTDRACSFKSLFGSAGPVCFSTQFSMRSHGHGVAKEISSLSGYTQPEAVQSFWII